MELSEFLKKYKLSATELSKSVSDIDLNVLSAFILEKWKSLPPHLEINKIVVEDIDRMPTDEQTKRYNFLKQWKSMKGSEATYKVLVAALLKIGSLSDAEHVCQQLLKTWSKELTIAATGNFMDEHPSYHQAITGREAKRRLKLFGQDGYLIRYSSQMGGYVLSISKREKMEHYRIIIDSNQKFKIEGYVKDFTSLNDLLSYYEKNRISPSFRNIGQCYTKEEYEFVTEILKAAKLGKKINRKHAHFMFIGPGESGKSSLMYRLLGEKMEISTSTPVAKPAVLVGIHSASVSDCNTWKEIQLNESLAGQIHENALHLLKEGSNYSRLTNLADEASASTVSESLETAGLGTDLEATHVNDDLELSITSTVTKCGGYKAFDDFLKNKFSLYLRDAGGQVEFQQMVSLLVFGPSIFLFVFNAVMDLDSKFEVGYRKSDSVRINSYMSSLTLKEALLESLASVYAMCKEDLKIAGESTMPHVLIVATHKDKLPSPVDENIKKLNSNLVSLIEQNGFNCLVQYADNVNGQVVFTVDNSSESDDDFKPIRRKIYELVNKGSEFSIEYSIGYLLFGLELQLDPRQVLTFEECKEMAAKYGIKEEDGVTDLLKFLHFAIGTVYFLCIDGVPRVVLKNPEDLFSEVTDITAKTFLDDTAVRREDYKKAKKGILSASLFDSIGITDHIIGRSFIKVLEHLHIIAPLSTTNENEYFLPCALNHVGELTKEQIQAIPVMPLGIKFKCKHCPKGLFGVLITYLMGDQRFQLNQDKIFKDQVFFDVHSQGVRDEMSLKALPSLFEIKLYPEHFEQPSDRKTPLSYICSEIQQTITNFIFRSIDDLHCNKVNVKPQMCLKCSRCSQFHEINGDVLHCSKDNITCCMPEDGKYWFIKDCDGYKADTGSALSSKINADNQPEKEQHGLAIATSADATPKEDMILQKKQHFPLIFKTLRRSVSVQWIDFGIYLGVDTDTLHRLEKENPKDLHSCLRETLLAWFEQINPPPTKSKIIGVLRELDFHDEAKVLEDFVEFCSVLYH